MQYILAHDLGTSGNKATLYDTSGQLVKSAVAPYRTRFSDSGRRAEQDAGDWWAAVCRSTQELLEGVDPSSVAAVSFSGHMMGCLPVDKEGRPLRPHLLYCDQRARRQAEQIAAAIDPFEFYTMTGHRPSASYTMEKAMWVRDEEPEVYKKTYRFLQAKDYIVFQLTGQFVTDWSDAGGTELFDINSMQWSEQIADAAGLDLSKFPDAYPSTHVAGEVTREAAEQTGIPAGTPVVCGAGDGCASGVGAGSLMEGSTYTCVGSSGWVGATSAQPILDAQMRAPVFPHAVPGLYHSCGAMQTAGASFAWATREVFGSAYEPDGAEDVYARMDREIGPSGPGAGGVLFLPYLMGERSPWWDDDARGCYLGVTQETTRGDMLRAVQEGVAFNLRIILDAYRDHMPINEMVFVGGAAKSDIWRRILADVYGMPVLTPRNIEECASMGAALIGGVGAGIIGSFDDADSFFEIKQRDLPCAENAAVYDERYAVFVDSYKALRDLFPRL